MDDDLLRCPNCGSTAVVVTFRYEPGQWAPGHATCEFCGASFKFRFVEEQSGDPEVPP
jgi:transcription elongation factor Elf1